MHIRSLSLLENQLSTDPAAVKKSPALDSQLSPFSGQH
jgi:hypothetical protein